MPVGAGGGTNGSGGRPKRRPSFITPRAIGLMVRVGSALDIVFLLQATLGFLEPVGPRFWNRPSLFGAALVKPALSASPDLEAVQKSVARLY